MGIDEKSLFYVIEGTLDKVVITYSYTYVILTLTSIPNLT